MTKQSRSAAPRDRGFLVPALGLGLALAFWLWSVLLSPASMRKPEIGLAAWLTLTAAALPAACVLAWIVDRLRAGRAFLWGASLASFAAYLAALKTLGWTWPPWLALAAVIALGVVQWRQATGRQPPLLVLLHAQATICALYVALRLQDYLAGWPGTSDAAVAALQILAGK